MFRIQAPILVIPTAEATVAALNFRLNWEGNYRTLETQTQSSLENRSRLATSIGEVGGKLNADPAMVRLFKGVYGHGPDESSLLDAIAVYERSLLTPGGRFDKWIGGDTTALTAEEQNGYGLFKSLGCVSCHQGVNIGGNLYERYGIFHRLASPDPGILRVPSLRNIATTAPYFHDGSAATLEDAVRRMSAAQLDRSQSHEVSSPNQRPIHDEASRHAGGQARPAVSLPSPSLRSNSNLAANQNSSLRPSGLPACSHSS
jgi:cytochrome c peroxidase